MECKWSQAPLGELISYISKGIVPKYTDDIVGSTMVLGQRCVRNQRVDYTQARFHDQKTKPFKPEKTVVLGDILINATGVGSAGRVAQVTVSPQQNCVTDGHVITLRAKGINPFYLGYFLKSRQPMIEQMAEGSTGQTEMNRSRLQNEIVVTFPQDNAAQAAIAQFGLSVDRKIAINNQINGYLAELQKTIYRQFLNEASGLFHEGTLSELVEVRYGKDHKKLGGGTIPVYGSGGFMRYADSALYKGEAVLIPRKGTLNNVMYVNEEFWTVDTMFYAVPKAQGAAKYAYQFLRKLDLASMNSGSAVPSMTTKILNALNLPIPSASDLKTLDVKLEPLFETQRMCDRESERLSSLRDALLPKLMSGEIDVSKVGLTQLNSHLSGC